MSWSVQQLWHRCSVRITNGSPFSDTNRVADDGALCANIVTDSISDTESNDLTHHFADHIAHNGTICDSYNRTNKYTHKNTHTRTNGAPNSDTNTTANSSTYKRTHLNTNTCTNGTSNSFANTISHSKTIECSNSISNGTDCLTVGSADTFTYHIVTHNIANDITHRVTNAYHSNRATHCFSDTDAACTAVCQFRHD